MSGHLVWAWVAGKAREIYTDLTVKVEKAEWLRKNYSETADGGLKLGVTTTMGGNGECKSLDTNKAVSL